MSNAMHKIKEKLTGDSTSTSGHHQAYEEAPVVKEHEHHDTQHIDKTQKEQIHQQDKVNTVIQPVKDEQQRSTQHHNVDEGTVVHERGHAGIDDKAEAELRKRREEIARQGGTSYSESHAEKSERPDTKVHEQTNTVQQVQPVIERNVEVPHKVDHHKKEIEIVHEGTKVGGTEVAPTVTVDEYNRQQH